VDKILLMLIAAGGFFVGNLTFVGKEAPLISH
jgi:hypothetical protein